MIERKIGPSVIPAAVHVASSRDPVGITLFFREPVCALAVELSGLSA
jgi:hypothetical protein